MDNKLSGVGALAYQGVRATTPPQMITMKRAPTTKDYIGYIIGTQWLHYLPDDPDSSIQYVLVSVEQQIGLWIPLNGSNDNPTLPIHSVALGIGTPGLTSTGPIATLGAPLVSNGVSADPSFGIATVSGGGTGLNDCVPYSVYCGGTTGEGPVQQVSGLGVATQVLTSNGIGLLPTWENPSGGGGGNGGPIAVQVLTATGTYTPTPNMASCFVEIIGGGAGGGDLSAAVGAAGGGGSGGYCRKFFLAVTIGASQSVTIGAGGIHSANGGNTTFGALLTANGGVGGTDGAGGQGGVGGTATGGDLNVQGGSGGTAGLENGSTNYNVSGFGGGNLYGAGGVGLVDNVDSAGVAATVYGSGGSGGVRVTNGAALGGAGANGICIVTEFGPYAPTPPSVPVQINVIVYDTPGPDTYTPTPGMFQCFVECVGGGGGAGKIVAFPGYAQSCVGGGAGGGYCKKLFDSATIGASQSFNVGEGGVGSTSQLVQGGNGGNTTFGAFLVAGGGTGSNSFVQGQTTSPKPGGIATGGNINIPGQDGPSFSNYDKNNILGGSSFYGITPVLSFSFQVSSKSGTGYGAGASGSFSFGNSLNANGANGTGGVIIVTEYIGA